MVLAGGGGGLTIIFTQIHIDYAYSEEFGKFDSKQERMCIRITKKKHNNILKSYTKKINELHVNKSKIK